MLHLQCTPRQWICRSRKIETIFLFWVILFIYWTFAGLLYFTSNGVDGDSVLHGLFAQGAMSASLVDFSLGESEDHLGHGGTPTNGSYHVHVVEDPLARKIVALDWNQLSSRWNNQSIYPDLLKNTQTVDMLPSMKPQSYPERIIFILHNHPKMASTTLRRACWENLRSSCDIVSPKRDPMGYSNAEDLASLLGRCKSTHHFCVMGWRFDSNNFPSITPSPAQPMTLIHLFPFRSFDDWAVSAMKQVFVGHSEDGCNTVSERLETCNGWLELDFSKYSKPALASMLGIMKSQRQQPITHHMLLYDFRQVHSTFAQLSRIYQVPMMPFLDMQYKQTRQEGSCSNEILKKFHACFDDRLLEL